MARPTKYGSDDERRRADAERKRKARLLEDPELPVRDIEDVPTAEAPVDARPLELILATPYDEPLSEAEEQLVKDHFGYGASERRTRAERAGVAQRIVGALPPPNAALLQAQRTVAEQERRSQEKKSAYLRSLERVPSP